MSDKVLPEEETKKTPETSETAETAKTAEASDAAETSEKKEASEASAETAESEAQTNTEDNKTQEEVQNEADAKAAEEQAADKTEEKKPPVQVALAPRCENPIIGRKIFFVNPPLYVENYLQPELKQNEYEAYVIKDYKYTKNALRRFPDALCFIFIDDELSYDEWFNFILSFQHDEKLKTIFVGLMSAMIPNPVREKFMMNLSLPGGFINLNEIKGAALIENIIGILELNGAKGRRKYIRLDCDENVSINGYFANQTQLLQVSIKNISSVGFTCYFPKSYGNALTKNMLVPSFSITLGRRSIVTPSVVYDVKPVDNFNNFAVLLFLKQVGPDDRKVIKNFIFEQLVTRFENLIYANPPDVNDYFGKSSKDSDSKDSDSKEAESKEADSKEEAESQESAEEIEEAEEVTDEGAETKTDAKTEEKAGDKTDAAGEKTEAAEAAGAE